MNLHDEIRALGVRPGDLLMLHVSLRGLGLARSQGVEAGAEMLLDAIEAAVGPAGTLLMVLGTDYPFDWVNDHPLEERASLLAGTPPFDYLNAPVLPEVGYFAEAFRQRPGTVVSDNPSGRFGARGARADEIVRGQPWNDYYGPDSPLHHLYDWGGRVLRLQASPDTTTVLHYAEYLASEAPHPLGLRPRLPRRAATRLDRVPGRRRGHCRLERRRLLRRDPGGVSSARAAPGGTGRRRPRTAPRCRRSRALRSPVDGSAPGAATLTPATRSGAPGSDRYGSLAAPGSARPPRTRPRA